MIFQPTHEVRYQCTKCEVYIDDLRLMKDYDADVDECRHRVREVPIQRPHEKSPEAVLYQHVVSAAVASTIFHIEELERAAERANRELQLARDCVRQRVYPQHVIYSECPRCKKAISSIVYMIKAGVGAGDRHRTVCDIPPHADCPAFDRGRIAHEGSPLTFQGRAGVILPVMPPAVKAEFDRMDKEEDERRWREECNTMDADREAQG